MHKEKICTVIPAAGMGTRLGGDIIKLLLPVNNEKTVWDILYEKIKDFVEHIHVVVSPVGLPQIKDYFDEKNVNSGVTVSVQQKPTGMGDAIFGASEFWCNYDHILVIWGDQIYVSTKTIQKTINTQLLLKSPCFTLPISSIEKPYVQYLFSDDSSELLKVKQAREGDVCEKGGYGDVGTFCLSTNQLIDAWQNYSLSAPKGNETKEINFLPFLPYLSSYLKWNMTNVFVENSVESRGINTQDDLDYFRTKYKLSPR